MKDYANLVGYSDITPFEIIREVNPTCLEVHEMAYRRHAAWKPEFEAGGFAGHCTNMASQRWEILPAPYNKPHKIRLSKAKRTAGQWLDPHGNRYVLADEPRRFYDYNF